MREVTTSLLTCGGDLNLSEDIYCFLLVLIDSKIESIRITNS